MAIVLPEGGVYEDKWGTKRQFENSVHIIKINKSDMHCYNICAHNWVVHSLLVKRILKINTLKLSYKHTLPLPSSLSVNRPIWGKSLNVSKQITPAARSLAIHTWSCLTKRGRVLLFSPVFLSTRQIKACSWDLESLAAVQRGQEVTRKLTLAEQTQKTQTAWRAEQ